MNIDKLRVEVAKFVMIGTWFVTKWEGRMLFFFYIKKKKEMKERDKRSGRL